MSVKLTPYLTIEPVKPECSPTPGTVVMTASEVQVVYKRIAARLDSLSALLDERTAAHIAANKAYLVSEILAKRKRKGL